MAQKYANGTGVFVKRRSGEESHQPPARLGS
jgi:hypothetical protein